MNIRDFKAMVSLLDDPDVATEVRDNLRGIGPEILPLIEAELDTYAPEGEVRKKMEALRNELQSDAVYGQLKAWADGGGEDLLKGLWLISQLVYPNTTLDSLRAEMNRIYLDVWVQMRENMHPADVLNILNTTIFEDLGFEPNVKSFHSPQNSLFNQVLSERTGNPVSLSCVYILLAQKLDIPLYGVNLPNLFVTLYDLPGRPFYVNVFNKGQIFYKRDIDDYLKQMNLEPRKEYYQACTHIEIVTRVLTNLAFAYQKSGQPELEEQVNRILEGLQSH